MAHNDQLATRFFENGQQIAAAVTVQQPASEIYKSWTGLSGLPKFVEGLHSVVPGKDGTLAMQAVDHGADGPLQWGVEILSDEPGRMVAWRSVGTPAVPNAGSVTLRELPFSRGTEVRVVIDYIPPKGALQQKLDKALGRDPKKFLQLALFRFRQLVEAGEVASTKGQPAGRGDGRDEDGSGDEKKFATQEKKS